MTSIAQFNFQNIPVELIDRPYEMGGNKWVAIKAMKGEPFADGAKTTTRTAYLTVNVKDLQPIGGKPNLLTMALSQERKQWPTSELVWLWGNRGKSGAYLKNDDCVITLNLIGYRKSLPVFVLDLNTNKWVKARDLETKYRAWANGYRQNKPTANIAAGAH